jgi:hypothetical protein
MARTTSSMVKVVKQKLEVDDILPQCSNAFTSFPFIELFDSSIGEDSTPLPLLMKLLKGIIQFGAFFVVRAIHPCGECSIYCLLLMHDGATRPNF